MGATSHSSDGSRREGGTAARTRLTRPEAQAMTRRRLLEAATELFTERGFHATSLADVADRAGYTIGAVYSNFASKDDLFLALMRERLRAVEASLASAFDDDRGGADAELPSSGDARIEAELDRLAAAEDAVPAGWWRLLAEFRAYAASNAVVRAELAESERRCRDIIADRIERFATHTGVRLPMPAPDLADLTSALSDGLRAAHAEGRISMTPGEGLRRVVGAMLAGARPTVDRA
jgi:AcrR family transcriptional regulator